jgi:hypothetical protein
MCDRTSVAGAGLVLLFVVFMLAMPLATGAGPIQAPIPVSFGPNIRLTDQGSAVGQDQRETTVAVNPRDGRNIVEGHMDHKPGRNNVVFSSSVDGGQTWTFGGPVPSETDGDALADPGMGADADGNFYYSYLDFDSTFTRLDVVVARSTDGGRSFPTLSIVRRGTSSSTLFDFPDRDYIGVDTGAKSPFRGTIYVAWSNLLCTVAACDLRIMVSRSTDRGATWSAGLPISAPQSSDAIDVTGPIPVVAPNGTVYVFYIEYLFHTGPLKVLFAKSKDGGVTWSAPQAVATGLPSPGLILVKNDDPSYGTKPIPGILDNSCPTAAVAPDGTLFVAWTDVPDGTCHDIGEFYVPCSNTDVRLSVSRDGGKTWSAPRKVSDETNATDQFFPWMAVHPNGLVSLTWDDKRLDPTNTNYDVFYTNTFDGVSFLPNVRVTSQTLPTGNQQTGIQDYSGMAVSADSVFPVWSDTRSSAHPDVYVAVGRLNP